MPPMHLILVRHGESTHNISSVAEYGDHGRDPSLYDAPLSPIGTTQACALSTQHPDLVTADLILSSPLTRALQTMCGAFPPTSASPTMEVWPLAAEHLTASCDIGSSPVELSTRFPHLDFSALPPVWWFVDADTSREDPAHSRERFREFGFYEPFSSFEARVDAFVAALRVRAARWDAALVSKGSDEHSPSAAFSVVCFGAASADDEADCVRRRPLRPCAVFPHRESKDWSFVKEDMVDQSSSSTRGDGTVLSSFLFLTSLSSASSSSSNFPSCSLPRLKLYLKLYPCDAMEDDAEHLAKCFSVLK